jgi:membrane protein
MSLLKVRVQNAWDWGGLSPWRLAVRLWHAIDQHNTLNQAAIVAYYAMLSLVPLLSLVVAAALGVRPGVTDEVLRMSRDLLPEEAYTVVHEQVHEIRSEPPLALLSISAAILLWSASSLFVCVMDATNTAYGARETRPWWWRRMMALVLTLIEVALLVLASVLAVTWPALSRWLGLDDLGRLTSALATLANWIVVVFALLAAFELVHFFGPNVKRGWQWVTPGSALGVLVLVAASLGFRMYLQFCTSYSATYGALTGVVLMLFWLYIAALALLVGAEVNFVIKQEKEGAALKPVGRVS